MDRDHAGLRFLAVSLSKDSSGITSNCHPAYARERKYSNTVSLDPFREVAVECRCGGILYFAMATSQIMLGGLCEEEGKFNGESLWRS